METERFNPLPTAAAFSTGIAHSWVTAKVSIRFLQRLPSAHIDIGDAVKEMQFQSASYSGCLQHQCVPSWTFWTEVSIRFLQRLPSAQIKTVTFSVMQFQSASYSGCLQHLGAGLVGPDRVSIRFLQRLPSAPLRHQRRGRHHLVSIRFLQRLPSVQAGLCREGHAVRVSIRFLQRLPSAPCEAIREDAIHEFQSASYSGCLQHRI